jgi:hypothetical protein
MQSYLSKSGFWDRDAQMRVPMQTTASRYGLAPAGAASAEVYGRLPNGGCVRCSDPNNYAACGGVDKTTGRPLPWRECNTKAGMLFNCYYPAPNSQEKCYGNFQRAAQYATLSSEPFGQVLKATADQPNYMDAVTTMMSGLV